MDVELNAFQTLADPTRRRIVEVLRQGEQPVGEVVLKAGVQQSGVSRHLRILAESGFVSVRPDGQRRLYSLRPEPFQEMDEWLHGYRKLWQARLDRFEAALGARQQAERRQTKKQRAEKAKNGSRKK
jgi:DNA-binding transcriptional ArsR family regulator